jgi:hypothetical protein
MTTRYMGCGFLAAVAVSAAAQGPAPAQASARAPTPASAPAPERPDPAIKRTVVEDDHVRIEELRVRGQLQRITISPKASGVRPYEIAPPDSGRDPSQQSKGISGHSLWQFFSF